MHDNHDVFVQAVKEQKMLIVTYSAGEYSLSLTRLCVPLEYSPSGAGDDSGCYYFWDSEADTGERILVLPSSQIVYIQLSNETFDPAEYIIPHGD
jgi:hypothetical protein